MTDANMMTDRAGAAALRPQARPSPPFVQSPGGHQLFVRDWGAGQPIVLLAGWGLDSRIWGETMIDLNQRGFRTIAYDRRGHGRSSDPGRADYDCLADDLAAVLDSFDLRETILVCHSGGAGEAIRYASRIGTERLAQIMLVGGTGPKMMADAEDPIGATPELLDALIEQLTTNLSGWIDANKGGFSPGTPSKLIDWMSEMVLDCSRRVLLDLQRAIVTSDLREEAAALTVPVTIIHGDCDVSAPLDLTGRRYAGLIPQAKLLVYEGAAHGLMVTHAGRLAADIAERLRP